MSKPLNAENALAGDAAEPLPDAVMTWFSFVTARLGREPRGFRDVAAFNPRGEPAVIRVASVVEGKPFPTLFWLIDADLNLAIDRLEAGGAIQRLQQRVAEDQDLRAAMALDHERHKVLRDGFLSDSDRHWLEGHGMMPALADRGIGGIQESDRIRCLHTWYAAHLVEPNCIGGLTDQLLAAPQPME